MYAYYYLIHQVLSVGLQSLLDVHNVIEIAYKSKFIKWGFKCLTKNEFEVNLEVKLILVLGTPFLYCTVINISQMLRSFEFSNTFWIIFLSV